MTGVAAVPGQRQISGCVPPVVARLAPQGRLPATNQLQLAISLSLRDPAGLNALLTQLYDPASTKFHKFRTPPELATRFGPTEQEYTALRQFAVSN
jgi:subtilase family serine protease